MLTEKQLQQALHASRVIRLSVSNPHGPLGLEQVAAAVASIADSPLCGQENPRIRRPISLSVQTWEKLERLAKSTALAGARPVTASEVATAILEEFVATTDETSD
jgi:hypothetical protein